MKLKWWREAAAKTSEGNLMIQLIYVYIYWQRLRLLDTQQKQQIIISVFFFYGEVNDMKINSTSHGTIHIIGVCVSMKVVKI